jgi:hypothetical protein
MTERVETQMLTATPQHDNGGRMTQEEAKYWIATPEYRLAMTEGE